MPPSIQKSNAKHYKSSTTTEYHEFPGRSHWTCGEPGWEAVADYALDWAVEHADVRAVTTSTRSIRSVGIVLTSTRKSPGE